MFDKDEENHDHLADEVRSYLTRFAYLESDAQIDALVLWIFHSHCATTEGELVFASTPRLAILSDNPGSGKTRVLELVEGLSRKGRRITDPSAPGILTLINEEKASLFIDEIDLLFGRGNTQRPIRSILNSGYRPGSPVMRMGREWNTYAPVALAGMAANFVSNPDFRATYSRSICIYMDKKPSSVAIDPWRERLHGPIADQLNRSINYWARQNLSDLSLAWPEMPENVTDRAADLWEPLLAVGDSIGPKWAIKAREACTELVLSDAPSDAKPLSPTQQLLSDLSKVFTEEHPVMPTALILGRLAELPGSKWGKYPSPRAAAMELSATLKPLGIAVAKVSHEGKQVQGYRRMDLEEHFTVSDLSDLSDLTEEDASLLPI